jgi:hypothetical protein
MADNLPPSSADVTESGSLNLAEPSGPYRPVMGLFYLLPFYYMSSANITILFSLWYIKQHFSANMASFRVLQASGL